MAATVLACLACTFPAVAGASGVGVDAVATRVSSVAEASNVANSKAPSPFERRHTPAGMAAARRVLLAGSDLGSGWVLSLSSFATPSLTCASFRPTLTGIVEIGSTQSPNFAAGSSGPFVSQASFVYATVAQATSLWHRVVGPGILRCLADSVQSGSANGVAFKVVSKRALPAPRLDVHTAAYRVVADATATGQSVTTYVDMLLLTHSRTVTEISFAGFAQPVSAALELRLARIVARRLG